MRIAYSLLIALGLSACASVPTTRYFSLQSEQTEPIATQRAMQPVLVQSVKVPVQLDRRQMVLTLDDGQGLQVLNDYQWASPLANEMQQGLSAALSERLGVPSAELSRVEDGLAYWRIDVDVQRFDSVFEQYARQDLSWRISPQAIAGATTKLCRISLQTPAAKGVEGLVQAHQALQKDFVKVLVAQMDGASAKAIAPTITAMACSQ